MEDVTLKIYSIKNLDCAHCASKIEAAINEMEEVEEAVLVFTAKKFKIRARHSDTLFDRIMKKCDDIEPGVLLVEESGRYTVPAGHNHDAHHSHAHGSECHCGDENDDHCHKEGCHCEDTDDYHEDENSHSHVHAESDVSSAHGHAHGDGDEEHSDLPVIAAGAVCFIAAKIISGFTDNMILHALMYAVPYLILGGEILAAAGKGILRGRVFNEKFLMSLATLAAFILKDFPEAVGVMLFFRIGEYFEDRAVANSRKSVMAAIDMRPETVNLVSENETRLIPAEDAVPGDIILVRAGDRIPLDGIVAEGASSIDTSSVTGEHVPVSVNEGDSVLSGCVNISGVIKIKVSKPLSESMVSRIVDSVENASAGKPQLDRFITRFANVYTPVVVIAAALTAVIPSLITGDWHKWLYTAVTFLVISCPCAIVLSVPLTYFAGIGAGSKTGILFKSGSSIEAVSCIKAVVMDKTGTITSGTFSVNSADIYSDTDEKELYLLCASCESVSTHPVGQCIVKKAEEMGLEISEPENISEIAGMGIEASVSGRKFLCGNVKLMESQGIDISEYTASEGGTDVICAVDGRLAGVFRISDTLKKDSTDTISGLKSRGIKTVMLTGDSEGSAAKTAAEAGLDRYFAKLMPEDKLARMKEIRNEFGSVMFVGDGINDAPVLAGADVSAAMGSGADAAIEAADIVIMNSEMSAVSKAFRISEDTNRTAKQNIVFALLFKAAVMILGIAGFANMWFAVFADSGVAVLCVLNSVRVLRRKY